MIDRLGQSFVQVWGVIGLMAVTVGIAGCAKDPQHRNDAEAYFIDGQKALLDGKCWQAQNLFRNLLSDFPGSRYVDEAQFGLGQAYLCNEDYVTAIFEFERLINEYPVSSLVDRARFQIGMCYFNQSRSIHHDQEETTRAIEEFTRFVEDYPNSDVAPEARKRIGDLRDKLASKQLMHARNYLKWGLPSSSEVYCRIVLEDFPDSRSARVAWVVLGRALSEKGDFEEAMEALQQTSRDGLQGEDQKMYEDTLRRVEQALSRDLSAVSGTPDSVQVGPAQAQ